MLQNQPVRPKDAYQAYLSQCLHIKWTCTRPLSSQSLLCLPGLPFPVSSRNALVLQHLGPDRLGQKAVGHRAFITRQRLSHEPARPRSGTPAVHQRRLDIVGDKVVEAQCAPALRIWRITDPADAEE